MKTIVLGCPYNGLRHIKKVIQTRFPQTQLIDISDITKLTLNSITINNTNELSLSKINCSFIRYPYDLIPPHSETFALREKTEFLKTLCLLLDNISPNPIGKCWALRNRLFSMQLADKHALQTPFSKILNTKEFAFQKDEMSKALGNCFYSWHEKDIPQNCDDILQTETDDDETAIIYPAQKTSPKTANFAQNNKIIFLQRYIKPKNEYRLYNINGDFFTYERFDDNRFDQSSTTYKKATQPLPDEFLTKIYRMQKDYGISYCCYDILLDTNNTLIVIDINPFGSLPPYKHHPEPTEALARFIATQ